MPRYALLVLPSANRVYASASVELTRAELSVFGHSGTIETFGGVPYVTFSAPSLAPELADLSTLYAAFEIEPSGSLRPLSLPPRAFFDDDLLTIQKYAGKTNEQFTKLLLNVTALSSAFSFSFSFDGALRVLDPLCGRGTTLNQALMYGWDAGGIDIDGKDFDAYRSFLESWLRRKRLKHKTSVAPIRREKKVLGRRMEVDLAPTAEAYKKGDRLTLNVVNADTVQAGSFFKPRSFHLVVGDLPYGVRHGSRSPSASLSRQPLELLRAALPGWVSLLRPGGALGLSWNTYGGKRTDVAKLLTEAGLTVCEVGADGAFEHRVDQSITRDLIVARRD